MDAQAFGVSCRRVLPGLWMTDGSADQPPLAAGPLEKPGEFWIQRGLHLRRNLGTAKKDSAMSQNNTGIKKGALDEAIFRLCWILFVAAFGFGSDCPLHAGPAAVSVPPEDKSSFHLFRPTPVHLMRELSADRPDKTESPYTVDAGHFQAEMDMIAFTHDRYNSERIHARSASWGFGILNLKVGLLNDVDLQMVVETWNTSRIDCKSGCRSTSSEGFGDTTMRCKVNLWGNDAGASSLSLMPFFKLPTGQDGVGNSAWEGGLSIPWAVTISERWSIGFTHVFGILQDQDGDGYQGEFSNSVSLGRSVTDKLGAYVEFFGAVSNGDKVPWVGTFDMGLTYAVDENIQIDAGVNIGLTRSADDWNPFLGLTLRF